VTTALSGTDRIIAALDTVRDPELDEPITSLGFVTSCTVSGDGAATVRLRLPTYFCAPNFAYLMVADAYDAVSALDGVRTTEIVLEDHFAAAAINDGVAAQAGFVRSFRGEAVVELDQLRRDFLRKAVLASTNVVCQPLLTAGVTPAALNDMTLGEVAASPALQRLRRRRADLGLDIGDDAPLLIDPTTGGRVAVADVALHLRKARTTKVGIDANTSICQGMLQHRYPDSIDGRLAARAATVTNRDDTEEAR